MEEWKIERQRIKDAPKKKIKKGHVVKVETNYAVGVFCDLDQSDIVGNFGLYEYLCDRFDFTSFMIEDFVWDFDTNFIDEMIEFDEMKERTARILYNAPSASDNAKTFLRMKYNF